MKNTENLVSISDLKKYFPIAKRNIFEREQLYVRANEDITLNIRNGETLGLVGESGCGKSTLGRTILQLYEQTAGSTMYYGRNIDDFAPAYVAYTLKNSVKMIADYKKLEEKAEALDKECEDLGAEAAFYQLQRRNLAIAEASVAKHKVAKILGGFMALDDPTAGARLLLNKHNAATKLNKQKRELKIIENQIKYERAILVDTRVADKKRESAKAQIKGDIKKRERMLSIFNEYKSDLKSAESAVKDLKSRYADNKDFLEYEKYLDDGIDLTRLNYNEMRALRRDLQIIFQDPYSSLNPRMTVGQIIEEGLVTHGFFKHGSPEMKEYILSIMRKCGLQDYMIHRYPHQFSGGQRQRICIARALAVKPRFVVCDECVSALDVSIQSQIINLLEELKKKERLTYLFISHDLSVVRYISDRIGVMYLGNIVELGDAATVFKDPRHPYTVALLSSIPTTDSEALKKERIILQGSIPSPIRPPEGCKFHTRCFMACEKCKQASPPIVEVGEGHYVACHFPERKVDEKGNYLFSVDTKSLDEVDSRS